MEIDNMNVLITGGAGFIGTHLSNYLYNNGCNLTLVDNLSNSDQRNINRNVDFIKKDLSQEGSLSNIVTQEYDVIFHLASNKEVNNKNRSSQFQKNTSMTHKLLEAANDANIENVVYTSSSTVYGEAPQPTPEDYAPLEPISVYRASKLANEGLLSAYAHSYGFTVWNFRFANIVGPGLRGAVIPDFIEKLRTNPDVLPILGNGRQEKSYMHIEDCIDAMCHLITHADKNSPDRRLHTFNLGTSTTTSVNQIAEIVSDELDLDPTFEYTGGDRGWTGDVPKMRLSIEKLRALGWEPTMESTAAVRRATTELAEEIK